MGGFVPTPSAGEKRYRTLGWFRQIPPEPLRSPRLGAQGPGRSKLRPPGILRDNVRGSLIVAFSFIVSIGYVGQDGHACGSVSASKAIAI